MSDKTSQRTQEEMLDQTFGQYDDEMTTQTEDPQTVEQQITGKDKKKNSNILIYAVGGLAAVGVVGYVLLSGQSVPVENQQVAVAPVAPVAPVNTTETTEVEVAINQTPSPNPSNNTTVLPQENFLANQNIVGTPLAGERVNEQLDRAQVAPAKEEVVEQTPASNPFGQTTGITGGQSQQIISGPPLLPPNSPPLPELEMNGDVLVLPTINDSINDSINQTILPSFPTQVESPSIANNLVQTELVSQLQKMFEKQTLEIKDSIGEIDKKVVSLEQELNKATKEQKDINKSLEERLAKLESGQQTKDVNEESKTAEDKAEEKKEVKPEVKPAPKPKPVAKPTPKPKPKPVAKPKRANKGSDVLVDKSSTRQRTSQNRNAKPRADVKIHSIFSGRVWTRNADGSLSTFTVGERLPNGEVIKQVGSDRIITTSGRVIR